MSELRPYQQECVDILDQLQEGRVLCSLATGLGKTVIFSHMKREPGKKTLILSHRDELVRQPAKYYDGICPFGIEKAESHSNGEDIVSASVQSLSRPERLHRFSSDHFSTIIVDECHHLSANNHSYTKIIDYFMKSEENPNGASRLIGFTATPKRGDKVRLSDYFDKIIFEKDLRWGIKNHFLAPIRTARVHSTYSLSGVAKAAGDFTSLGLDAAITGKTVEVAARLCIKECLPKNRHVLIFVPTRNKARETRDAIRQLLPEDRHKCVEVVLGDTDSEERARIIDDFCMDGETKILVGVGVFLEGTDLPICDTIINLRPTTNTTLYQQMIGRATRLYEGKEYMIVYDILPEDRYSRRQICTAPTLLGIAPEELDEKFIRKLNIDTDLVDFCDDIRGTQKDVLKLMNIHVEKMRSWLDEIKGIFNHSDNIQASIDLLNQRRQREDKGNIDFGDILTILNPSEEERYEIHPTYNSVITVSDPDLLGNVLVKGPDRLAREMKVEDAVKLVRKFCEAAPPGSIYSWNRKEREKWAHSAATERQITRLSKILPSKNLQILNKLDASDLINLSNRRMEAQAFVEKFCPERKSMNTLDELKTAYQNEYIGEANYTDDESFDKINRELDRLIEASHKRKEESHEEQEKVLKLSSLSCDYNTSLLGKLRNKEASDRQINFANSMVQNLYQSKILLDNPISSIASNSVAVSLAIELMKLYTNQPALNDWVTIKTEDFLNEAQRILKIPKLELMARESFTVHYIKGNENINKEPEIAKPVKEKKASPSKSTAKPIPNFSQSLSLPNRYLDVQKAGDLLEGKSVTIYTDGSYHQRKNIFGCGAVLIDSEKHILEVSAYGIPEPSENGWDINGEIGAAILAIEETIQQGITEITIYHDYEGIGKWAIGVWNAKQSYIQKYVDYIKTRRREGIKIRFLHVKGHSEVEYKDRADRLADSAVNRPINIRK